MAIHQRGDAGAVIAAVFQPPQRIQQQWRRVPCADEPDTATHQRCFLFLLARYSAAQFGFCTCWPRPRARASGATSAVITLPAPTNAPSPTDTGATRTASE